MQASSADAADVDHLARLWRDAWHEAHVPPPLELTCRAVLRLK